MELFHSNWHKILNRREFNGILIYIFIPGSAMNSKVIFLNGFSKEEALKIMRAVKSTIENPDDAAFCMGTEANREWLVKDLIAEVREEHDYMKKNPPEINKSE